MSVPADKLNDAASQQPSVTADEQQLSQFDDIPDDIIDGMSGGADVDDDDQGSDQSGQPNSGFSAHEDEPSQASATETPEGTTTTGEEQVVDERGQEQQQTQDQVQEPEVETEEQRKAREEEVAKRRTEYIGELTKKYALSDEDAEKALLKPEEVLPNLAANLHANVVQEVLGLMQAHLPVMIQQVGNSSGREAEARNAFFAANPDLNKPEYEQAILSAGQMFRQMNKNAKPEETIKAVGRLARAALNLPEPSNTEASSTPAKPFRPARPGGSGTPPAPRPKPKQTEGEPDWAELSKDD